MCVSSQCIVGNGKIESLLFLFLDRSSSATNRMQLPHWRSGVLLPLKRQHTPPNFGCSYCKKVRYQKSRALGSIFPDSIFLSGPPKSWREIRYCFPMLGKEIFGSSKWRHQENIKARVIIRSGHHQSSSTLFEQRLEKKLRRVVQTTNSLVSSS